MPKIPTGQMKGQIDAAVGHLKKAAAQDKRLSQADVEKAAAKQSPEMGALMEEVYARLDKMQVADTGNARAVVTLKDFTPERVARLHASVDRVDKNHDGSVDSGEMSSVRGKTAKLSFQLAQAAGQSGSSGSSSSSRTHAGGAVRSSGTSSRGSYVVVDNGTSNGALYATTGHAYAVLNAPGVRSRL